MVVVLNLQVSGGAVGQRLSFSSYPGELFSVSGSHGPTGTPGHVLLPLGMYDTQHQSHTVQHTERQWTALWDYLF